MLAQCAFFRLFRLLITLSIDTVSRVHARRISLKGPAAVIDVCPEWGLGVFQDLGSNLARPLDDRLRKRTELLILETALTLDRSTFPDALLDDLRQFASRYHVQLSPQADLWAALRSLTGSAAQDLQGIMRWYGWEPAPADRETAQRRVVVRLHH